MRRTTATLLRPGFLCCAMAALSLTALRADTIDNEVTPVVTTPYDTTGNNLSLIGAATGTFSGAISGDGFVFVNASGSWTLSGSNSYSGGTFLEIGTLRVGDIDAVGTGTLNIDGGTIGNETTDSMMALENNVVASADFSISAQGDLGSLEFFGNVDLGASATRTITLTDTGLACFGGVISGQNLTFLSTLSSGTSQVMVCSNTSNIFTGTLRVGANVLMQLDKDSDNIAVPGAMVIDEGGVVETWLSQQFSSTSTVTVNGALRELYSETTTISVLTGTGSIFASESGMPTQTLVIGSGTFAGTISEETDVVQSVEKQGPGLLRLTGSNSYSGGTLIHSGTLAAGHNHAVGTGQVRVEGGVFLVEADVAVANTVKLAGGAYDRTFSGSASLAGAVDASSSFSGGRDTSATILAGELTQASTLHTSFATTSGALNDNFRRSDVYSFQGTGTDVFVLQLSFSDTSPDSYLAWLDTSSNQWVNAIDGNTGNNASAGQMGYAGDFAAFQIAYGTNLAAYIGAWGTETNGGTTITWAVLNHNSDFAAIPEPQTWLLAGAGLAGLLVLRRRVARTV